MGLYQLLLWKKIPDTVKKDANSEIFNTFFCAKFASFLKYDLDFFQKNDSAGDPAGNQFLYMDVFLFGTYFLYGIVKGS